MKKLNMCKSSINTAQYGKEDASFIAAGGMNGLRKLVDDFYHHMSTLPVSKKIFEMHTGEIEIVKDKLTLFLCGWLGGELVYRPKYGRIIIPLAHGHLEIGPDERDAWMYCMMQAVADQSQWPACFKKYFLDQIYVPAERTRNQED
mgnify:CR=1 FL=1|jgi:hemoglobin